MFSTMVAEPRVVWLPGGLRTEVHLVSAQTGGAFCMLVDQPLPGWSLPAHRHANEAETIHVVEGEFEMDVDGTRSRLSPGQTIHVPRGAVHSGGNVGQEPGRRVVLFTPAGIEGFFLEAGTSSPDEEVDLAAALAAAARHGWEFVGQRGAG
jgi:quercetin dioxygenase-like cupin family protein